MNYVPNTLGQANNRTPGTLNTTTYIPAVAGTSDARLFNSAIPVSETLMTPFDWYVHLDRPLINQLELLHVTAGKPHEATLQFIVPNNINTGLGLGKDIVKYAGAAPWLQTYPITAAGAVAIRQCDTARPRTPSSEPSSCFACSPTARPPSAVACRAESTSTPSWISASGTRCSMRRAATGSHQTQVDPMWTR